MKMRRLAALLAALTLAVTTVAGCSGGGENKEENTDANGSGDSASASGEDASAEDDKSPITFTFYSADMRNDSWDNPVAEAITEATGVSLEITYPVSSTGDPSQDVALMIANDDYPDLIYSKGSAGSLYDAGAFIDMRDLIEEYGPNIKKMYGDEFEKLSWSSDDDGIYQLSYAGVNGEVYAPGTWTCAIQYAALEENNYDYPETLEEYEAMIKAYLEAHPTTEDGLEMYGISLSASDWHWLITLSNPAGMIGDAQPDNGSWVVDEDYNVIYKHTSENEKEYFKWLSRMYDEGILDPNFATQTDDDYIAKLAGGQVVGVLDPMWHFAQAEVVLEAEGKYDQTFCQVPVTLREDQKSPALMDQGLQVGYGIGISKSCKDPVRAIKFLDFLCSDEGAVLYKWGVEGVNYFIDENGQRYRTEEEITASKTDPDYAKNTGIGNYAGFPCYGDGAVDENGNPYTPNTKESVIAEYNPAEKAACEAWGTELVSDIFPQADEFEVPEYAPLWAYPTPQEITNIVNVLNEISWPGLVKCVTGGQENFDANWDALVAELEDNGLEEANQLMTEFLATKLPQE